MEKGNHGNILDFAMISSAIYFYYADNISTCIFPCFILIVCTSCNMCTTLMCQCVSISGIL